MPCGAWLAAGAALLVVWSLAFAPQLFQGRVFTLGDAREFRPFSEFSRDRWHQTHQRTFWNPYVFAGIDATSSLADSRPQYLPDWGIDLYERVRLPGAIPLAGPLLAHLMGMLAAAALARALWGVGPVAMVWAGVAWGLLPDLIVHLTFGHGAQFVSSSLLPVVLLGVHAVFAAEGVAALAAALGLALIFGVQCLTGHPQIVVYTGMLAVGFAIERAWRFGRWPRLGLAALAAALGAAIAAAVWWPALLYSIHSFRGGAGERGMSLAEVERWSLGWSDLVTLAWPHALGLGGPSYWGGMRYADYPRFVGATVVLLAFAGLWSSRRAWGSAERFWAVATVISLLVALGTRLGPVYTLLHDFVPMWSKFRVPPAALVVGELGLALLSARGLERALADPRSRLPRATWLLIGGTALLGLLLAGPLADLYASFARGSRPLMPGDVATAAAHRAGWDLVLRIGLVAVMLFSLPRAAGRRAWQAALIALLLVDLGSIGVPFLQRATGVSKEIEPRPPGELARMGAAEPHARVLSVRRGVTNTVWGIETERGFEFYWNDWIAWRARSLGGNHGAVPSVWRAFGVQPLMQNRRVVLALGVSYLGVDPGVRVDSSLYQPVRGGDQPVYRLRGAMGRVYAVPEVVVPGNDLRVVAAMQSARFDPARVALTTEEAVAGRYPGSSQCRVQWVEDEADRLALDVAAPAASFLVIADSDFPGWTALLDGRSVPIHVVNHLLRGVAVPAGRHRLVMTYEPEGWHLGVATTRVALMVWMALALGLSVLARNARRPPSGRAVVAG